MSMDPLYITDDVRRLLWGYVDHVTTEIGGLGYCNVDAYGNYVWDDIFLLPQEVSGGSVDFDDSWVEYAITRATEDNMLGREGFSWVSWHSHGNLSVMWSATDEEMIEKFGSTSIPHVWSVVGNRSHDVKIRLDLFKVRHGAIEVPHVKFESGISLIEYLTDDHLERVEAEVKALVRPKTYATRTNTPAMDKPRASDPGDKLERSFAKREGDLTAEQRREAWYEELGSMTNEELTEVGWEIGPGGIIWKVDAGGNVIPETVYVPDQDNSETVVPS